MNKKFIITLLLLLVTFAVRAQVQPTTELVGSWSGKLNIGAISLTLVLNLEQADGYAYQGDGEFDTLFQMRINFPVPLIHFWNVRI